MRYEIWAVERIRDRKRCAVEPSMTCIPLREDPICRACYEGENNPPPSPFRKGGQEGEMIPIEGIASPAARNDKKRNVRNDTHPCPSQEGNTKKKVPYLEGIKGWAGVRGGLMLSRRIEDLTPAAAQKCREFLALCKEKGIGVVVTSTLRTEAEQLALFAQGRKNLKTVNGLRQQAGLAPITGKENRIVTKNLTSVHQSGRAFDVLLLKDKRPAKNEDPAWDTIGPLGESLGLRWGGRFGDDPRTLKIEGWDKGHFEWTGGLTLADLEAGKRQ